MKYKGLFCAFLLAFSPMILSGCETEQVDDYDEPTTVPLFEISNEDVFENGCYEYQSDYSGNILFRCGYDDNINWNVYIVDEQIADCNADSILELTPTFVNPTTTQEQKSQYAVQKGQWIYIYCDCNSQTSEKFTNTSLLCWHWGA